MKVSAGGLLLGGGRLTGGLLLGGGRLSRGLLDKTVVDQILIGEVPESFSLAFKLMKKKFNVLFLLSFSDELSAG